MSNSSTQQETRQTIFPALRYVDARGAIDWLQRSFGAQPVVVYEGEDGAVEHAELRIEGNLIMVGSSRNDSYPVRSPRQVNGVTAGLYVVLSDNAAVDLLYRRAISVGAQMLRAPYDTDYGSHEASLLDLEGYPWTFGTYRPSAG